MTGKISERRPIQEAIEYLRSVVESLEEKIKALETRLALLESRVNQPVGGPAKR